MFFVYGDFVCFVQFVEIDGCNFGVRIVNNFVNFFKGWFFGFNVVEVNNCEFKGYLVDVDNVEVVGLVFLVFEVGGVGLVVDGQGSLDVDVYDYKIFGVERVGQDFDGIGNQEFGLCGRVEEIVDLDENDNGFVSVNLVVSFVSGEVFGLENQ